MNCEIVYAVEYCEATLTAKEFGKMIGDAGECFPKKIDADYLRYAIKYCNAENIYKRIEQYDYETAMQRLKDYPCKLDVNIDAMTLYIKYNRVCSVQACDGEYDYETEIDITDNITGYDYTSD